MEDALSSIWNEDGTPKRPEPDQGAEHAFADFAFDTGTNDELYTSYANARAKILKLTQAVATPHDEDKARTTWHWPEPS
jgi:hypothetical protein